MGHLPELPRAVCLSSARAWVAKTLVAFTLVVVFLSFLVQDGCREKPALIQLLCCVETLRGVCISLSSSLPPPDPEPVLAACSKSKACSKKINSKRTDPVKVEYSLLASSRWDTPPRHGCPEQPGCPVRSACFLQRLTEQVGAAAAAGLCLLWALWMCWDRVAERRRSVLLLSSV